MASLPTIVSSILCDCVFTDLHQYRGRDCRPCSARDEIRTQIGVEALLTFLRSVGWWIVNELVAKETQSSMSFRLKTEQVACENYLAARQRVRERGRGDKRRGREIRGEKGKSFRKREWKKRTGGGRESEREEREKEKKMGKVIDYNLEDECDSFLNTRVVECKKVNIEKARITSLHMSRERAPQRYNWAEKTRTHEPTKKNNKKINNTHIHK